MIFPKTKTRAFYLFQKHKVFLKKVWGRARIYSRAIIVLIPILFYKLLAGFSSSEIANRPDLP
jgi:hypothetical protein